jgi:hypothetical protein
VQKPSLVTQGGVAYDQTFPDDQGYHQEVPMNTVRWNIAVSPDTDQSVRMFLASQGGDKGDLSRFIEEMVRAYIFERTVEQAKSANANISESDLTAIVAEAVQWARAC